MARFSTAHYFLEALVDLGVDYIFANLGTDHVSLIEEIARWDKEGRKHPDVILCPHEVVAVHMEAINHCLLTRADLSFQLEAARLVAQVAIPQDGDTVST